MWERKGRVFVLIMLLINIAIFLIILFSTGCASSKEIEVLQFDKESSEEQYEFKWSKETEPYLKQLKSEFELGQRVKYGRDDLDKVLIITHWVHNLWKHDGSNAPKDNDPISILREVQLGQRFRCVEYAVVINGCLNAVGIPSRVVGLKTEDVETRKSGAGHVVVEAYIEKLDKWVMIDGQWNAIVTIDGMPLNSVELQEAIAENRSSIEMLSSSEASVDKYLNWIDEYLYYFDVHLDNRVGSRSSYTRLMLVPEGATEPKVFQRKWPMDDMIYTNSLKAFYTKP